jgi:hypothetical protein
MKKSLRPLALFFIVLFSSTIPQSTHTRTLKVEDSFQGKWEGTSYFKGKTPSAMGTENKGPPNKISLDLVQQGEELKGEYGASIEWGRRFETGTFSAKIKGSIAEAQLESGWGGKVTVILTLHKNKLYWKMTESKGENYFPNEMNLYRSK